MDLLSAAYASDLESLVEASGVALWAHGHTHVASDYEIGKTRVVCNPHGYKDELVAGFRQDLTVEIRRPFSPR
jgi:hypothetical protein